VEALREDLDLGEAEAIVLAMERRADPLLIDVCLRSGYNAVSWSFAHDRTDSLLGSRRHGNLLLADRLTHLVLARVRLALTLTPLGRGGIPTGKRDDVKQHVANRGRP
jgi:hypothetical protein